ncbi:MAG: hypothetical protein WC851_00250 [Candidatus Shapirobacteria bacterium]|jgi:hypothetical protein
MIEFRHAETPTQSDFEKGPLSAIVVVLFNRQGEVFLKKKKNPNEHGVREISMISGRGPLSTMPDKPDRAAIREVAHSVGHIDAQLWRGFVDTENNIGVYIGLVEDPQQALDMDHGHSVDRHWVKNEVAANMDLAFGQQNYIQRALQMISEQG